MNLFAKRTNLSNTKSQNFLGSFINNVRIFVDKYYLSIGVFSFLAGIVNHNTYLTESLTEEASMSLATLIPFVSEISVIAGSILSIIGIVIKVPELKKMWDARSAKKKKKK